MTLNIETFHNNTFDAADWLRKFRAALQSKNGSRELRANIFQETVKVVSAGSYCLDGNEVKINNNNAAKTTEFFDSVQKLFHSPSFKQTSISVIEADCLETAELMIHAGYKPCVLNMASHRNPGGGVLTGSGAQEENLFRRSNMFVSLYQFAPYAQKYGINKSVKNYPLNRNTGGIYSAEITVFRASENNGYCFLKKPFQISVVSVPTINRPDLEMVNGKYRIIKSLAEPVREKIRTILRIAGKYRHDCLILGALGCGAFRNPPNHVAELFKEVFREPEFENQFRLIVFSILSDHNSWLAHNPEGNVLPFLNTFNDFEY